MYSRLEVKDNTTNEIGITIVGASTFLCDSAADIEFLPVDGIGIGSQAIVITEGKTYIFGPSKQWLLYGGVTLMNK